MDEDRLVRDVHPMVGRRLNLWRLRDFELTRLEAPEDVLLCTPSPPATPQDQRLVALAQVRQLVVVRDETGKVTALPHVERAHRQLPRGDPPGPGHARRRRPARHEPRLAAHLAADRGRPRPADRAAGQGRPDDGRRRHRGGARRGRRSPASTGQHRADLRRASPTSRGPGSPSPSSTPPTERVKPARRLRRRRWCGPAAAAWSTPTSCRRWSPAPGGTVVEHDLDDTGRLVPVDRPYGAEQGRHHRGRRHARRRRCTPRASPGCCSAATRCARSARWPRPSAPGSSPRSTSPRSCGLPVEWFALSAGARISMDSGTENMDWVARALKRIIEFTQAGRRDQHRRRRHQRRRAALLERRGDDAHAHQGHPRHDARLARWCSPASSRSTSPAASRPRTTSASAATTGSWAPTARRSTGPRTSSAPTASCWRTTSTPTSRRARPVRAGRRPSDPHDRDVTPYPHDAARAATSRRSATSSRRRPTPTARRPSTSAP